PVASLATVTVASGTIEPVWSVTVPTIEPVVVCAAAGNQLRRRHRLSKNHRLGVLPLIASLLSLFNNATYANTPVPSLDWVLIGTNLPGFPNSELYHESKDYSKLKVFRQPL